MTQNTGSTSQATLDFAEIEAAVMETERGRWFLSEFARQNRTADTTMLLEAIAKLEGSLSTAGQPEGETASFRTAICDMAGEIAQAKKEIAELAPGGAENVKITNASAELDAIVESTETATSSILEAAEAVQELAWTLREEGVSDACCDALDQHATEIYTACSFQDITGQRITKVVGILRMLDARITTMAQLWGTNIAGVADTQKGDEPTDANLLNGPALEGEAIDQDEVDRMMLGDALKAEPDEPEAVDEDNTLTPAEDGDALAENASAPEIAALVEDVEDADDAGDVEDAGDADGDSLVFEEADTQAIAEALAKITDTSDADKPLDPQAGDEDEDEDTSGLNQKDFDALFA